MKRGYGYGTLEGIKGVYAQEFSFFLYFFIQFSNPFLLFVGLKNLYDNKAQIYFRSDKHSHSFC